jgi:hypothetical protein
MGHASAGAHDVLDSDAKACVATVDYWSHQWVEERHRLGQMWSQLVDRQQGEVVENMRTVRG